MRLIHLRPTFDLCVLIDALEDSGLGNLDIAGKLNRLHQQNFVWDSFDIHPDITVGDLYGFSGLVEALETTMEVLFSEEDLWQVHGALSHYQAGNEKSQARVERLYELLTRAVGSLSRPPY